MIRTHIHILSLLCALILSACTDIEYGYSEDMPNHTDMTFRFDWDEARHSSSGSEQIPEDMTILMSRIINTVHYVWQTDTSGNIIDTRAEQSDIEYDILPTVENGTYFLATFNYQPNILSASNLAEFAESDSISLNSLILSVRNILDEEIDTMYPYGRTDFNPSQSYIANMGPMFIDTLSNIRVFPENMPETTFSPTLLTQKITFKLDIKLDDEIIIDHITAEISGVGGNISLISKEVDASQTYRMAFEMTEVAVADSIHTFQGDIHAFGLFPSRDRALITGPGIMQLTITANAGEFSRNFHAGINLYETITGANLMKALGNGHYIPNRHEAELYIKDKFAIRKEQLVPGENDQGVDNWFDSDDNRFDTEF